MVSPAKIKTQNQINLQNISKGHKEKDPILSENFTQDIVFARTLAATPLAYHGESKREST